MLTAEVVPELAVPAGAGGETTCGVGDNKAAEINADAWLCQCISYVFFGYRDQKNVPHTARPLGLAAL